MSSSINNAEDESNAVSNTETDNTAAIDNYNTTNELSNVNEEDSNNNTNNEDITENNNNGTDGDDLNGIILYTLSDSDDEDYLLDSNISEVHEDERTNIITDEGRQTKIWRKIVSSATLREKQSDKDYIRTFMPMNQWYTKWSEAIFEKAKECMLKPNFRSVYIVAIRNTNGNHYTYKENLRLTEELEKKFQDMDEQCHDAGLTKYVSLNVGYKRYSFEDLELEMGCTIKDSYSIIATCSTAHLEEAAQIINASPVKDQYLLITKW